MTRLWLLVLALLAGLSTVIPVALAEDSMPPSYYAYRQLDDPTQEQQAHALMQTLRCLVCQGQSIADSDASMAGDMRHQVRLRIARGESPDAVRDWLIARYGEWVSYDPPVDGQTILLWVVPFLLLAAGMALALPLFRRGTGKTHDGRG